MNTHQAPGKTAKPFAGLVALVLCSTAFGASSIDVICDESDIAELDATVAELAANQASNDSNLTPQAEELIRRAFEDDEDAEEPAPQSTPVTSENSATKNADDSVLPATLPGLSNQRSEAYKRQMYRTDI